MRWRDECAAATFVSSALTSLAFQCGLSHLKPDDMHIVQSGRRVAVPKLVQDFVVFFYVHIRERNIREIYSMYSVTFPTLSDRFFKGGSWPRAEAIAHLVDNDHVYLALYKELYFRHVHANGTPTLEQRKESWMNYTELFTIILTSNLNMQLPNGWLFDMIDEYLYQWQHYLQYRGKLLGKTMEEIQALKNADQSGMWDSAAVTQMLEQLVARSSIREELAGDGGQGLYASEGYSLTSSNVLRMLGYFSLIGLLRVHCVLGDHEAGLRALAPINLHNRKGLFATKIAMAAITLAYYSGFAYLMMNRYYDAASCFNFGVSYVSKVKAHHRASSGHDQMLKKNEQMYAALAITSALCPVVPKKLDEAAASSLREKYGDKIRQMASGSTSTFEDLFNYCCPRFVSQAPPEWSDAACNSNLVATKAQLSVFMETVEERKHLPALKQILKLYSSIPVSKLASIVDMDEKDVRAQLELLRSTSYVKTWVEGADALGGEPQHCGDLEFSIESRNGEDVIVGKEAKAASVKGDFLIGHIKKFNSIIKDLATLPPAKA
jgi:translation initiation factor 3 subunit L